MEPQEFVAKWRNVQFGEKQASQEMFLDMCALVDHPTPGAVGNPEVFTFEKWVPGGFADAYYEEHFGWEFKTLESELDYGLNQLLRYQVHLKTPPLLVVSTFRVIRIQTNFPGMETVRHEFPVSDLIYPENLEKLRWLFHAPANFRPNRSVAKVTRETADLFDQNRYGDGRAGRRPGNAGPLPEPNHLLPLRRGRRAIAPRGLFPNRFAIRPTTRPGLMKPCATSLARWPAAGVSAPSAWTISTATCLTGRIPFNSVAKPW